MGTQVQRAKIEALGSEVWEGEEAGSSELEQEQPDKAEHHSADPTDPWSSPPPVSSPDPSGTEPSQLPIFISLPSLVLFVKCRISQISVSCSKGH